MDDGKTMGGSNKKMKMDESEFKLQCRISCGADAVIENVLPYLLPPYFELSYVDEDSSDDDDEEEEDDDDSDNDEEVDVDNYDGDDGVCCYLLVRAADGSKMSKTKVNVIDPLDTASVYGADTLMEKIEGENYLTC